MRNLQNPAGVEMRTELQKCAKPKLIKVPDAEYSSREIAHKRITLFLSTFRKNGTPEIWHTKLMEHALSSPGSVGDPSAWRTSAEQIAYSIDGVLEDTILAELDEAFEICMSADEPRGAAVVRAFVLDGGLLEETSKHGSSERWQEERGSPDPAERRA